MRVTFTRIIVWFATLMVAVNYVGRNYNYCVLKSPDTVATVLAAEYHSAHVTI